MEQSILDAVDDAEFASDFTKDAMRSALGKKMSVESLRYDDATNSIKGTMRRLGELIEGWNLRKYSADSVGVGYAAGSDWSLTPSEAKWVIHAVDNNNYDFRGIERKESPDFLYDGSVGIEVKSRRNYSISRKQLRAIAELDRAHIYLVTRTRVEVVDTFDWIGLNEYQTDR